VIPKSRFGRSGSPVFGAASEALVMLESPGRSKTGPGRRPTGAGIHEGHPRGWPFPLATGTSRPKQGGRNSHRIRSRNRAAWALPLAALIGGCKTALEHGGRDIACACLEVGEHAAIIFAPGNIDQVHGRRIRDQTFELAPRLVRGAAFAIAPRAALRRVNAAQPHRYPDCVARPGMGHDQHGIAIDHPDYPCRHRSRHSAPLRLACPDFAGRDKCRPDKTDDCDKQERIGIS
jgi:hypothetical protein